MFTWDGMIREHVLRWIWRGVMAVCGCVAVWSVWTTSLALLSLGSVRAADDAHLRMKGAEHLQHLNSPAHAAEAKSKREGKAECAHCEMGKKKGQGHSKAGRHTCHPCGADMDCGCHKAGHESKPNEPAHRH